MLAVIKRVMYVMFFLSMSELCWDEAIRLRQFLVAASMTLS